MAVPTLFIKVGTAKLIIKILLIQMQKNSRLRKR